LTILIIIYKAFIYYKLNRLLKIKNAVRKFDRIYTSYIFAVGTCLDWRYIESIYTTNIFKLN